VTNLADRFGVIFTYSFCFSYSTWMSKWYGCICLFGKLTKALFHFFHSTCAILYL